MVKTIQELGVGTLLQNRFLIKVCLASGGYGDIWRALDTQVGVDIAIKILRPDAGNNDPHALVRMRQEAEMLSTIPHPNIVKIYGYYSSPFGEFIAMELLRGLSLGQWIDARAPAQEKLIMRVVLQMLDALAACHRRGVIHRDLKPENIILIEEKGSHSAKLVDFGIAKASQILTSQEEGVTLVQTLQGGFLGTPRYAAPELVVGDPFGPSIDLYSFGLVVAEWLTGRRRMDGLTHGDVMNQVINSKPIDVSDCPLRWRLWLARMIDREPKRRLQTAEQAITLFNESVVHFHQPAVFVETRVPEVGIPQSFNNNLEIDSLARVSKAHRPPTPIHQEELPPISDFFAGEKPKFDLTYVVIALVVFAVVTLFLILAL